MFVAAVDPAGKRAISQRTLHTVFGKEGAGAINDLNLAAKAKIAAQEGANITNSGGVVTQGVSGLRSTMLGMLGYSSGADIGAELLLQHPGLLAGGILLRPGTLARPAILPPLENVAVLIVAGTQDTTHLPDHAVAVARLLAEAGAQVDFSEHPADHGLTPHDFALGKQWLAQQFQRAPVQR